MSDADAAVHDMTQMFLRAVDAAQPAQFMAQALPLLEADFHRLAKTDAGRLVIGGFGKASAAMAQAFEQVIPPALLSRTEGMIIGWGLMICWLCLFRVAAHHYAVCLPKISACHRNRRLPRPC